ncbi:hypothetical protein O181_011522 [Austropuccinia psidii MF-1]|uniref:Uncharacterized protein n=1 Tax=Austropuccinia psidii MF-1 TaxID=1389203 RepID=A0A9Q3GM62_9BASI|nr:hypothetical protein [Austropuccinia psidii MF-1]
MAGTVVDSNERQGEHYGFGRQHTHKSERLQKYKHDHDNIQSNTEIRAASVSSQMLDKTSDSAKSSGGHQNQIEHNHLSETVNGRHNLTCLNGPREGLHAQRL